MGRRRGGKRKTYTRHPSGQLVADKHPDDRVRASRQPHRRQLPQEDRQSEKAESPLGRLNLRRVINDELYEAGIRYSGIVGAYRAVIEGPRGTAGSGRGVGCISDNGRAGALYCQLNPKDCKCLTRRERYDSAFEALMAAGQRAAKAVARVAVHREELQPASVAQYIAARDHYRGDTSAITGPEDVVYLVRGLKVLAHHFGLTARRERSQYE